MSTNVQRRSGFSMIELVFVIVILGVLAAVAVPRFVATRTDAQVATARSDMASAQKAIVAKVFADNIDATIGRAPDPNLPVRSQTLTNTQGGMTWGEWIIEISGLDGSRWKTEGKKINAGEASIFSVDQDASIEPVGNTKQGGGAGGTKVGKGGCGAVLGIAWNDGGFMVFAPNNIKFANSSVLGNSNDFCAQFMTSYQSSGGWGNKIVPLASSGTVEF